MKIENAILDFGLGATRTSSRFHTSTNLLKLVKGASSLFQSMFYEAFSPSAKQK
jgi:hypothetical protein